ncbi:MAG: hypothetical protein ABI855_04790 [Bacteroidota bacterium]
MKENDYHEIDVSLLISYAKGLLFEDAAEKVRKALEDNEMLRWEYEGILQLLKDFPDRDPEKLLEEISAKALEKTETYIAPQGKKNKIISFNNLKYAIAACLIIALVSTVLFKSFNDKTNMMQLAENEVKTYKELPDVTRGEANEYSWINDFAFGKFDNVIQAIQTKKKVTSTDNFYIGLCYLKIEHPRPEKAEQYLNKALLDLQFQSDAYLFLGISQLSQKKNTEAKESLSHSKHPQAAVLLDLMRK